MKIFHSMNHFLETNKKIVLTVLMLCLAIPFIWILKPFWITILLGLVFAISLEPIQDWLERKMKGHSNWALTLVLMGLLLIVVVPFGLALLKGSKMLWVILKNQNTQESLEVLKGYQANLLSRLEVFKDFGLDPQTLQDSVWDVTQKGASLVTGFLGDTLAAVPEMLLLFFVLILSIISFLTMKREFKRSALKVTWLSPDGKARLITTFRDACRSVIVSTIVTGLVQASMTAIATLIFTDYNVLLIFFITFVLSFIPVIGAGPVSLIMAMIAFYDSQVGAGIGLLVFSGIISVSDNVIRPWLLAGSTEIPSIWALFCTLGAIVVMGLPGLIVGPLIGALAFELIPILADEYKK